MNNKKIKLSIITICIVALSLTAVACSKYVYSKVFTKVENENNVEDTDDKDNIENNNNEENDINLEPEVEPEVKPEDEFKKIMEEYNKLILSNSQPSDVIKYIDENISKLDKENADLMLISFESFQEAILITLISEYQEINNDEHLLEALGKEVDINNLNSITDATVRKLVEDTINGGFLLNKDNEGFVYPSINYSILEKYSAYLSDEINSSIKIKSAESQKPYKANGIINITVSELLDRALGAEKHLLEYKDGRTLKKIYELYSSYMEAAIIGVDGQNIYADKEGKLINKEITDMYVIFVNKSKDSITSQIVTDYLILLKEIKYNPQDEKAIQFYNTLFDKIREKLIDININ